MLFNNSTIQKHAAANSGQQLNGMPGPAAVTVTDNRPQAIMQRRQVSGMQAVTTYAAHTTVQMVRTKSTPKKRTPQEQGTEIIFIRGQQGNNMNENGQQQQGEEMIDMDKIKRFLQNYKEPKKKKFRHRKEGQRIEIHHSSNETLKGMLDKKNASKKKKGRKQFHDPSYHDTVEYIDAEYEEFYEAAEDELNAQEIQVAFDMLVSGQTASVSDQAIETSEHAPLTTMTPSLMEMYHETHYKKELLKQDDTSSSRAYESDYIGETMGKFGMSNWRPFVLPDRSSSEETTMVNSLGGTLDSNVPTTGRTIGQGKVYSAIYKHFQKTMEIINILLDEDHGEYQSGKEGAFKERTKLHTRHLEANFLKGLYANEKEHFSEESGFTSWQELARAIDGLVILVSASLDDVPEDMVLGFSVHIDLADMLKDKKTFIKKFELLGAIIGMMVKKEKRLLLNYQMLGKYDGVKQCLENLYELNRVEGKINMQISSLWHIIGPMLNRNAESKQVGKELKELSGESSQSPGKMTAKRGREDYLPDISDYIALDDFRLFNEIGPQLTSGRMVPLDGYQVGQLLELFNGSPSGRTVTYNGAEYRVVTLSSNLPKTSYNPGGLALGLVKRLRGG